MEVKTLDNEDLNNKESLDTTKSKYKYQAEITQMMYVFGEKNDPIPETVMLIEDIVRSQVIELIVSASKLAAARGTRTVTPEDLIFLIRRDKAKVNRLRTFLAWKDVRKNTKDSGGADAVEDLIEEAPDKQAMKKMSIKLPWELINSLTGALDEDSEEDEESIEAFKESMQRLKNADAITVKMSRDEYVYYSECRQASFTYRKAKKFRDWCYMSNFIDTKANDDLIDIMGFLTFEIVGTLTEKAIEIKEKEARREKLKRSHYGQSFLIEEAHETFKKRMKYSSKLSGNGGLDMEEDGNGTDQEEDPKSLFAPPKGTHAPLEVADIQEAFREIQMLRQKPLRNFRGGLVRSRVTII